MIETFSTAVSSKSRGQVAQKIESIMQDAVAPVLSGLASLVGLKDLDKKVKEFAQNAKDKATKPVKLAVNAIAAPFKKALERLYPPGVSTTSWKPLLEPVSFSTENGKSQQLWIDQKGKLWVSASAPISLDDWLQGSGPKGKTETQEERNEVRQDFSKLMTLLNNASGGSSPARGDRKPGGRSPLTRSSGSGKPTGLRPPPVWVRSCRPEKSWKTLWRG